MVGSEFYISNTASKVKSSIQNVTCIDRQAERRMEEI